MTIKNDQHGAPVQAARPALAQNITTGAGSVQCLPFGTGTLGAYAYSDGTPIVATNNTLHIRLVATAACWIVFGSNPIAVAGGPTAIYLPAFTPEYFWVAPGERIAAIQDTGSGTLNIAELAP